MHARSRSCPVEGLYNDQSRWLTGWLQERLGCRHQAADLAQDTFVRLLNRRRKESMPPPRRPRAFLKVIAKGLLIDHYRRRDLERAYLEALARMPEATAIAPEERELLLETLQQIDAALDKLPRPVRRAFLLSQLDGLSYARIAVELSVSERTVKRYMQQGVSQCLTALL